MIPPHILAWAADPGPRLVLEQARHLIERGGGGRRSVVRVVLTPDERRQVGRVLDAVWATGDGPVPMGRFRDGLARHGVTLEELLEGTGGPLRDLRAERRQAQETRETDYAEARRLLQALDHDVPDFVLDRCLAGIGRVVRAQAMVTVVNALDEEGERLPVLAARLFRDAHALDRSTALGRAVARFLSGRACVVSDDGVTLWRDPVEDSEAWRAAWASRGVVCDEVSTQVLVLNLPLVGPAAAATLAGLRGEPVWLTLRSLRGGVRLAPGVNDVFVCENPSVVETAADRHGGASRPLVCTFGVPSQAAIDLLRAMADQATLHVRADEDAVGRRIAEGLLRLPGARPWRMSPESSRYEEELIEDLVADLA